MRFLGPHPRRAWKTPRVYSFIKDILLLKIALVLSLGTGETHEWKGIGSQATGSAKGLAEVDLAPSLLVCKQLQVPWRQGSQVLRIHNPPSPPHTPSASRTPHQASPPSLSRADLTLPPHLHGLSQSPAKRGLLVMHTRVTWEAGEDTDSLPS